MVQATVESLPKVVVDYSEEAPIRVLHVDDEASFLRAAKQILEMQGNFQVETAATVEEALKKMKEKKVDIIVSDYMMPGKNGLRFLKELRKKGNNIPFILLTGKGREEVAINALNLGAARYFNKTSDPETVFGELAQGIRQTVRRKKAEKELKKAYAKLEYLVKVSPTVIYTSEFARAQGQWVNTFVSENVEDILGYEPREFLENPGFWDEYVHPEDKAQLHNTPSHLPQEGRHVHEFRFLHKDGTYRWMRNEVKVEHDSEGKLLRCIGYLTDITEQKEVEKKVKEIKEKYAQLIKNIPCAVFSAYPTSTGATSFVSNRWKDWTGYAPEDFLKDPDIWSKFIHPEDRNKVAEAYDEAFRTKKEFFCEYRAVHRDTGQIRYLRGHGAPIMDEKGRIIRFDGVVIDITERKKAEQVVRESQEKLAMMNEKLRVVGGLTRHDVRNKLSVVAGNIFLVKQKLTGDHEALKYLNEIKSTIKQIEKIFDFARIYEKLGVEDLVYVGVEERLDEAVSLFPDLQDVRLVNDCHGLKVLADSLLRQLFYNLIDNSLKHGEKVSHIRVYYKVGKEQLKLVYEDDGIGIPKTDKEKIFKEGYGKGTGYGLYMIRKMCEVYGWAIRETGKPGKGAQFTMTIPKNNVRIEKEISAEYS